MEAGRNQKQCQYELLFTYFFHPSITYAARSKENKTSENNRQIISTVKSVCSARVSKKLHM